MVTFHILVDVVWWIHMQMLAFSQSDSMRLASQVLPGWIELFKSNTSAIPLPCVAALLDLAGDLFAAIAHMARPAHLHLLSASMTQGFWMASVSEMAHLNENLQTTSGAAPVNVGCKFLPKV